MIKPWHIVAFVIALIGFAIWRAPISLAAPPRDGGFAYERATGTIWAARFEGASWAGLPAGAATWRLNAADLLQGVLTGRIEMAGPGVEGGFTVRRNLAGARTIGAYEIALEGAPIAEGLMLDGRTVLRELDLRFDAQGQCTVATGRAESDVLSRNAQALGGWSGPALAGTWACAGDTAELTLRGLDAAGSITVLVNVRADGDGFWRAEALSNAPAANAALAAVGFAQGQGGAMRRSGEFQWLQF